MDIDGHPPFHWLKSVISDWHFFGFATTQVIANGPTWALPTIVLLVNTFPMVSRATQTKIISKSYAPGKLEYQLTTSGPAKLLAFHLLGSCLGFLSLHDLCEKGIWPLCNTHLANACSRHISSQRSATTIQASFVIVEFLQFL